MATSIRSRFSCCSAGLAEFFTDRRAEILHQRRIFTRDITAQASLAGIAMLVPCPNGDVDCISRGPFNALVLDECIAFALEHVDDCLVAMTMPACCLTRFKMAHR